MQDIGDRMKANYEDRNRFYLARRTPVIVRVDGKAFHTYTRGFDRPFDMPLVVAMVDAAKHVAEEMQGFKAAYIQSDEASFFLTDYDELNTEAWFDYNKSKIETIAAATMTAYFNVHRLRTTVAVFDARSFSIPKEEVVNYFLWRAKDWERNSVSMYCRSIYSANQMHGQGKADQHELLHQAGKNWATDLSDQLRNGTWLFRSEREIVKRCDLLPKYADIAAVLDPLVNCDKQADPTK